MKINLVTLLYKNFVLAYVNHRQHDILYLYN